MRPKQTSWLVAFALASAHAIAAGPIGVPNTFQAGATAKAADVNANFTAVVIGVNDIDARATALESNIVFGPSNTFIGVSAGNLTMTANGVTGNGDNTAIGVNAFLGNTTGAFNTASGASALRHNTTGNSNTATGAFSLQSNTSGVLNTAIGTNALFGNTVGNNNTASGFQALFQNTIGSANTAGGSGALGSNTSGDSNTASGASALGQNTTGNNNTASGASALLGNTTGAGNTAGGVNALQGNSTGNNNTALGQGALSAGTTGSNNIGLGALAGSAATTGSDNIEIGNAGGSTDTGIIRIGNTQTAAFIAGIVGAGVAGSQVLVNPAGQLGVAVSSRRFKDDISDMGGASGVLMKLRPVTFHYKSDRNPGGRTLQYGLVAEEVNKVAPGLVARSADGKIETVYYQFLAPMLVNEYQKQQHTIDAQAARLEEQKLEIAELRRQAARIAALERRTAALLARMERAGTIATAER